MRMRQEQIVFAGAVAILGLLAFKALSPETTKRGTGGRGGDAEVPSYPIPDTGISLPDPAQTPRVQRDLFAEPQDTSPLAPLSLVEPPRDALPALLPPTVPGPSVAAFGPLLRRPLVVEEVPGLFDADDSDAGDGFEDDLGAGSFEDPGPGPSSLLTSLGYAASEEADTREESLTPEEREAFKLQYDWILKNGVQYLFGRVENRGRFGLSVEEDRGGEAILFTEVDPRSGTERFPSMDPIVHARDSVADFAFADTVTNSIEIERLRVGDSLTRARFSQAMALARLCIEKRLESARALAIAEELFRMCAVFDSEDPEPRLGLARCMEAGFDFDGALQEYLSLLERFPYRAEVHVRLARLEERLLIHDRAESRLAQAVEIDRGSWEAWWGMGTFLSRRGRHAEAIVPLRRANHIAPQAPELLGVRVAMREDLGAALLAMGEAVEARRYFSQAVSADASSERAQAALIAVDAYLSNEIRWEAISAGGAAGFELLLARGVANIVEGDGEAARLALEAATEADPIRAYRAHGALSYLAEASGYPAEAMALIQRALEGDPEDPWSLYQEARLLIQRDEVEEAAVSLKNALEADVNFDDALVLLGDTAFRLGRYGDAERYLERAVSVAQSPRAEVHALRGINFLRMGSVPDARASFERSSAIDPADPVARGGLAWCTYLEGEPTEALVLLANIDESRRQFSDDDPHRVWARDQIGRIQEHSQKVLWSDRFERKRLLNAWFTREGAGPVVSMVDGSVRVEGVFQEDGVTWVHREYPASLFVSLEARVWISADTRARVGLFVARTRDRRGSTEILGEASVSRQKEGSLQVRLVRRGQTPAVTDMQQPFPTGEWARLRIERTGAANDARITLFMNGIPLMESVPLAGLGRASTPLLVGMFVEGQPGRRVEARLDDVEVVYRQPK